jgi:hypothetical protein
VGGRRLLNAHGKRVSRPSTAGQVPRVYYLTSAEHAISNIAFGRLKLARFTQLNDPYELLAPKSSDKKVRDTIADFRKSFDQENGLLCFGTDWTDPVPWSHYGAKHTGICLGFNVKKNLLRDVTYQSSRMVHDFGGASVTAKLADLILCTKFESWAYERESRVLVPLTSARKEGELHFVPFDDELELAEVILGPLCSLSAKNARRMVDKHHTGVSTIKSRLALKSYNIVPLEASVPVVPQR